MKNKIDWIRSGLIVDGPKFMTLLPLPNKFLLSDILKLYSNAKITLDKVIIDMTISAESMAKMVIEQWEMAVKGKKYICPWTTYTSALFAKAEGIDVVVDQLWTLLVENRWSHLLPLARWAKDLPLGSAKLDKNLKLVDLGLFVGQIIKSYGISVKQHHALTKDMSRPPPSTTSYSGTITDPSLVEYIADMRQMLYVTSLEWLEGGAVKKLETLVKHTILYSLCKSKCKLLLATTEGWTLREKLGDILKDDDGNDDDDDDDVTTMTWWDGFLQKVVDLVLVDKLGLLSPGTISESIAKPLCKLCEAMMFQSEKHVMHLDNPTLDITTAVLHPSRLAEMRLEYMPKFPSIATGEDEETFWKPIKDQEVLKEITHLNLAYKHKHEYSISSNESSDESSDEEQDNREATLKFLRKCQAAKAKSPGKKKAVQSSGDEETSQMGAKIPLFFPSQSKFPTSLKHSIAEVEHGPGEDIDNASRSNPQRLDMDVSDNNTPNYNWTIYKSEFLAQVFDSDMNNVPVMPRILQDTMSTMESDEILIMDTVLEESCRLLQGTILQGNSFSH
ncbi:hypothetical protein EV363DRAFT_1396309 [Boletus edulis]|nr:hypothetical protein EV363DRAFT_1396309 [Boletus edulis]